MPQHTVNIKWGKEIFPDIVVTTDAELLMLKAQIFALTGVRPERQKIMIKGNILKDDNWETTKLKDGLTILMMGSKDEDVPTQPPPQQKFVEDMSESEITTTLKLPVGLTNLGNTCYLNSTIQCLKAVPELKEALKTFFEKLTMTDMNSRNASSHSITASLGSLYKEMEEGSVVTPFLFVQVFRTTFPRFAIKSQGGDFQQQDASECWTELIRMLQEQLPAKKDPASNENSPYKSLISQFFGGTFESTLKCNESEDEPATTAKEDFLQLSCFIAPETKYMFEGIKSKLKEQITKFSSSLQKDATYTKTSKITRLPAYLTVQFVRFQYKGKAAINAKILKDVKFPINLDVFDLCSEELQKKLTPMREKFEKLEEYESKKRIAALTNTETTATFDIPPEPFSFEDDLGSNNSGYYVLKGVVTHQGRTSSSGHYVGWVHQSGDTWLKCNDDEVSMVTKEDILKLSGGGDWHSAYILLYGPRLLQTSEEAKKEKNN